MFNYYLIGLAAYLIVATGHFGYLLSGIDRTIQEPNLGQYILLFLTALFWPLAWVLYGVHLIRTR